MFMGVLPTTGLHFSHAASGEQGGHTGGICAFSVMSGALKVQRKLRGDARCALTKGALGHTDTPARSTCSKVQLLARASNNGDVFASTFE